MKRKQGLILAILGASFWGLSGVSSQFLFKQPFSPIWLVGMRLFVAGLLMLLFAASQPQLKAQTFKIWQSSSSRKQLLLFSFLGFLPAQLAFFLTIGYSNVATAAALQFLNPLFTIIYCTLKKRCLPNRIEMITIGLSLGGTLLLVTNGNFGSLSLAPLALFWGIVSAIGAVFYSLLPQKLLNDYDATIVVGWGMFLGSLPLLPVVFLIALPAFSVPIIINIVFVVLVGTLLASLAYIKSLAFLPAATTQMLGSFEPLTATLACMLVLQDKLGGFEILGMVLIVSVIFIQFGFSKLQA